jgi:protein-disulfide isomerase
VKRDRLLLLAGAIAVAVIVVVVAIVLAGGGGGSAGTTSTTAAVDQTSTSAQADPFAGVPQHGDTLGRANAAATLTVYEDPQCPYCRDWALGTLPTVIATYVRTGRVKLVYHGIEVIGANSQKGLRALYAAGAQNKLWNVAEALYVRQGAEESGWITDAVIRDAAAAAGANGAAILAASPSPKVNAALRAAAQQASADHVQGTPTFVLQQPPSVPQQLQVASLDPATFSAALDAALQ